MNLASWIILVILVLIIGVAIYFTFKNKKSCCNCGKDNCPMKYKNNKNKQEEDVLEGMMCQGGCISGVCSLVTNPLLIKRDAEKENAKTLGTNISDVIKTTEGVETTYEKTDIK